ncbi:DUF423 domain-containing protein [Gallibacterium anatis]|uniref:DUF423 domain-containing protein n=1 Tax=Gallibacterium anatis TaxID=750 RepID=A0AAX3XC80_9PAST|nr:DUF423 domain-containing protein [Gallibacterium anatis]MDK9431264.1 DUF423 domain-containing protein [Gallibacterium anatis]WIM79814.1 DUF423 domain-containing protein [Gallibacterium anatis]
MFKRFLIFTALNGFFCVAFGAFSSHVLSEQLSEQAQHWLQTGWNYQVFHTLALFCVAIFSLLPSNDKKLTKKIAFSGYCWLCGIVLFCFSLYCLAITGNKSLAHLTPFGGLCFLLGWGNLIYTEIRYPFSK